MWRASASAGKTCRSSSIPAHLIYKTSSFQTSSAEFELNYLVGSVSGTIGFESVTFGSYQVTSQVFALANQTHNLDLSSSEYSGILGLSFPLAASIASNTGKTLLENLFSYFDDSHRFFAFKLGRELDDSSFTLGQLDPAIGNSTEDFTYTAVYPGRNSVPDYWKLPLRSITLNSTTLFTSLAPSRVHDSTTPIAVLDTGTSFILGPSSDVDALWNAVGATRKTDAGQWQVRCNRAVTIGFVLGDHESMKEYPVDPADINLQGVDPEGWCIAGIQPSNKINSGDWILGDAFLRNVYVVHHGSTAQRPPLIGLLTMTEPTSALQRFQRERGSDSEAPIEGHSIDAHHEKHPKLSSGAICGIIATGAFLVGGSGTLLFQIYKSYRRREGKETTP
ncbi:aspartic peptidase [Heterobasidion irregulare TC 32-1]|uniref:Aspartic peptidase n=1 Tax=Heterobasidion irregulare (strain TC 32-1) TaxID=747525 RepID=W4KK74_HETIT|nr:aspartic peptidase [Heterobasidion irregulare TC 32-1]ETW85725.1 aspartic peptidase [Heterobasidion irregulare TC 32-1]